jgi:hypothetical protein
LVAFDVGFHSLNMELDVEVKDSNYKNDEVKTPTIKMTSVSLGFVFRAKGIFPADWMIGR